MAVLRAAAWAEWTCDTPPTKVSRKDREYFRGARPGKPGGRTDEDEEALYGDVRGFFLCASLRPPESTAVFEQTFRGGLVGPFLFRDRIAA